jgi:hypothetical protein
MSAMGRTIDELDDKVFEQRKRIKELESQMNRECVWTVDTIGYEDTPEDIFWRSGCGMAYVFASSGVKENGFKFCPFCGGRLVVK